MVHVTRLNGSRLVINPDLIERLEAHPDTVVHLVSGEAYIVKEPMTSVIEAIVDFRGRVILAALNSAPANLTVVE